MNGMHTPDNFDWVYEPFTYQSWQPGDAWSALVDEEHYLLPLARALFWKNHQEKILSEIRQWTANGWEPMNDVGPSSIEVCKSQETDSRVGLIDVFFWILTLGVGLLIHLFLGTPRSYVVYRPVVFRIQMRHPCPEVIPIIFAAKGAIRNPSTSEQAAEKITPHS
jgi:hypothetical protein